MLKRCLLALVTWLLLLPAYSQMPTVAPSKALAPAASKAITIYLVRHAEKASPTGDAELSEAGTKRAACLANTLADTNLKAVYTTEYKRTKNTGAPTAEKTGITPTVIKGADVDKLIAELQKEAGRSVLVVGHSNTVPKVIEKLGAGTVTIKDEEYDHLYIVTLWNGEASLASLRYCN
ncbi:MAG TPA: phosphoglycerate mutase family protein [Terriglobales bacterium]|nr:phosphoglycerate mutase family protein [Terriglobales bacterium]